MEKTLHNSDVSGTQVNVPDVRRFGDADMFQLLCKASSVSEGWMKSTKACFVGHGCIVQVTTQQRNSDSSYGVAEALTYVPGVCIGEDIHEDGQVIGRHLRPILDTGSVPMPTAQPSRWAYEKGPDEY